jgi:multidrug efflux system membrane fusion protein
MDLAERPEKLTHAKPRRSSGMLQNYQSTAEVDHVPSRHRQDHTSPRPPRHRGRIALWLLLLGVIMVGGLILLHRARHTRAPEAASLPVPVTATTVSSADVPITLDGLGTVQAYNTVSVHTQIDGQIVAIDFKEGQMVHAGDVLAQIDPRSDLAQLASAQAKLVQDQYQLKNSKIDLSRFTALVKTNDTTRQQVATQEAQVGTQTAETAADEAQIDSAQVALSYTTIRSPVTGRTGIRQIDIGNIVHTTDATPIVVVTQLQPISLIFTLPEQDLAAIQDRQDADKTRLTVQALDDQSGALIDTGHLELIDNEIDQTTGTIKLKATFPNARNRLWPGAFVTARLIVDMQHDGLVLPAQAIQNGPNGAYVFAVKDEDTVSVQPVKVVQIAQNIALISQGVRPGERVVLDGQSRLQPGSAVTIASPTAAAQ